MLDQNDLLAIERLILASELRTGAKIDAKIDSLESRMQKQMDERFDSMQKQMDERFAAQDAKMEERILASETMLLEEMDRMDRKNERRFSKLEKDIEELKEIYRMTKNESDTIQMLLHIQEDMEKRLTAVEQKIA